MELYAFKQYIVDTLFEKTESRLYEIKQIIAQDLFSESTDSIDYEGLDEAVSKKDFQKVADLLKEIPDENRRAELAKHHVDIFKTQNPRFDQAKFYAASGVKAIKEDVELDEAKNCLRTSWGGVSRTKKKNTLSVTDQHQKKICIDTVKNPAKGQFLGGVSAEEAEEILRKKHGYTDAQIKKLKEDIQLDELKASTLGNYIRKAGEKPSHGGRGDGVFTALQKLQNGDYDENHEAIKKAKKIKEDIQLDELKAGTLGSYIHGVERDIADKKIFHGGYSTKKIDSRFSGKYNALNKLKNGEFDENPKNPLKKIKEDINEDRDFKGKSPHYDTFVSHASEIGKNLKKVQPEANDNVLHNSIRRVMLNMALPDDNPNYRNTEKYMPKNYDKKLYRGNGNSYESPWMSHNDAKMDTVIKNGIRNSYKV